VTRDPARGANFEAFQTALLIERTRLLADAAHLSDDERAIAEARFAESDAGGDQADIASDFVEQEILETLEHTVRATLMDIDAALDRIESGTYGLCEDCGEPIDRARLKARPWANRCLKCQRRAEMHLAR
jgi:DnaK suppressor protein